VLAALVAGEAAEAFERQPAAASVERVLAVLRRIYEPQGIQVPAPVQVPPLQRHVGRCSFGARTPARTPYVDKTQEF